MWNPLRLGSDFQTRVFIKSKALRDRISSIFKVKPGGVVTGATVPSQQVVDEIVDDLHEKEPLGDSYADMFEIVFGDGAQEGTVLFHPFLEIMRTLALKAPVCHLVKPHIMPDIQRVIDEAPVIDVLPSLCRHSPMLARLLHGANGGIADPLIIDLLTDMLKTAKGAFPENAQVRTDRVSDVVFCFPPSFVFPPFRYNGTHVQTGCSPLTRQDGMYGPFAL